jgi:hypothetical protein
MNTLSYPVFCHILSYTRSIRVLIVLVFQAILNNHFIILGKQRASDQSTKRNGNLTHYQRRASALIIITATITITTIAIAISTIVAVSTIAASPTQDKDLTRGVGAHPQTTLGIPRQTDGTETLVGTVAQIRRGEDVDGGVAAGAGLGGHAVVVEGDGGDLVAGGVLAVPCCFFPGQFICSRQMNT